MNCRRWLSVVCWLAAALLILGKQPVVSQTDSMTADQIIANYLTAIGGSDKIAAIKTLAEKGELSGNLAGFANPFAPPSGQSQKGLFEVYFQAPNLRSYLLYKPDRTVISMSGCTGTLAWYIDSRGVRESKPKPENEYECKPGYDPLPGPLREQDVHLSVRGKKKMGDSIAWVIRVEYNKSSSIDAYETYYFDAATHLLSRWESFRPIIANYGYGPAIHIDRLYSDYRDVGGLKLPFMVTQKTDRSSLVTILKQVEMNGPIEATRFEEPPLTGLSQKAKIPVPDTSARDENTALASPASSETPIAMTPTRPDVPSNSEATLIRANFVNSSIAELQQAAPELRGLKPASDQSSLATLLDKVGKRIVELSMKIPNLISREEVLESEPGTKTVREEFSYLILARGNPDAVTLEEFRVDSKTGAVLETDASGSKASATDSSAIRDVLARASQQVNAHLSGRPPLNQGFASMWARFHPANHSESDFRYLGEQNINQRRTLVISFAQKPGSVHLPGEVRFKDKSFPFYQQGIAWVDPSDFRIIRMRTYLLSPVPDISLNELTADAQFTEMQVAGFATPLLLPQDVKVTSLIDGHTFQDNHSYSNYRSFQAHSRILLNP